MKSFQIFQRPYYPPIIYGSSSQTSLQLVDIPLQGSDTRFHFWMLIAPDDYLIESVETFVGLFDFRPDLLACRVDAPALIRQMQIHVTQPLVKEFQENLTCWKHWRINHFFLFGPRQKGKTFLINNTPTRTSRLKRSVNPDSSGNWRLKIEDFWFAFGGSIFNFAAIVKTAK